MKHIYSLFILVAILSFGTKAQTTFTREDTIRGTVTPERRWWDVSFYDLSVSVFPETKTLSGNVIINYKVKEVRNVLQVDLQFPLHVDSVIQNHKSLKYEKDGNNAYKVYLKDAQRENSVESIIVYYSGKPIIARNPPWQGGFQFVKDQDGNHFIATSCQGLGASAWWPCKDHSYDEPDSMMIRVTVPEPLKDISNGRLRNVVTKNGSSTYEWFVKNPINNYGVNINIGNYTHFADTLHGEKGVLDLDFYVLPRNLEKAKIQFAQAKLMLRAFEYWFGPYPFYEDGYKLVETPYLGMEHQSSVTYGNGFQNGYRGRDLSGTGWGLKWDFIIIHESGHEWFANNITYQDIADMWIHESFTNYSETLFTEYYYGKEAGTDYVVGTRRDIQNDIPIIGIYGVNQRGSGDMYPKGGNMLHTIRHSIGNDDLFRKILRGLNETFYHQTVTTQQIESYISQQAGFDYSKVFDQYLRDVKIPKLEYYVAKGKVYYRWANCVNGFNLPLVLTQGTQTLKLLPTPEWKSAKVGKDKLPLITKTRIERQYYVTAVDTSKATKK